MDNCQHAWKMTNTQLGFTVFEQCAHCQRVRSYYSEQDTWDEYREGDCTWRIVENAQSLRFDLECVRCRRQVTYGELRGLLYCTSCMEDCEVERVRKRLEADRTMILVAMPHDRSLPVAQAKLDILTDYFNQRRDTSRSKVKIIAYDLIKTISLCRGEFIRDTGMLTLEPVVERPPRI